MPDLQYSFRIP